MAYFDSVELVDYSRHIFGAEDDTGLSYYILPRFRRRRKPGGIGLVVDDSDSDDEDFELPNLSALLSISASTANSSAAIRTNLLAKYRAFSGMANNCVREPVARLADGEFSAKNGRLIFDTAVETIKKPSMTSRLIFERRVDGVDNSDEATVTNAFSAFARFEATDATPAAARRTMRVIFPFCQPAPVALSISIVTRPASTLADLIGLSCYVYTRERRQPPCEDPASYSLYMAEEDSLQYDAELPPQDRYRLVADCGFPTLALVKNNMTNGKHCQAVTVYLSNGASTVFELETCDVPLQWLFDKAMEWRREMVAASNSRHAVHKRVTNYILETLDQSGSPLILSNTIASTGAYEFVLLRLNSARGEAASTTSSNAAGLRQSSRSSSLVVTSAGGSGSGGGGTAQIGICELGIEFHPVDTAKRKISRILSEGTKILRIFWDQIALAEVSQPEKTKVGRLIRIVWLLPFDVSGKRHLPIEKLFNGAADSNKIDDLEERLSESCWKTLQLEVNDVDAWSIGVKMSNVLDGGSTFTQRVYQHSYGATKTPLQAVADYLAMHRRSQRLNKNAEALNLTTSASANGQEMVVSSDSNVSSSPPARSRATTGTSTVASSAVRNISQNMRGMAFSRLFSKPN